MSIDSNCSLSRRKFLQAGTCLAGTAAMPARQALASTVKAYRIVVGPGRTPLRGRGLPMTDVWTYDGKIPGPTLRLRQGEPVRVVVENRLDEDTTVHWHGIRLPNAMDGVPGLTQAPIKPGDSFVYEFTPPDAGTFWYHPHANSLSQLGRGLAGALIVEEPEAVPVDRDLLWVITDWRLTAQGEIASGFGNRMEAAMSDTVTINGTVPDDQPVRGGERDRLLLGPAMRIDVVIDMRGEPGKRYSIIDDFYDGLAYTLTRLAYANQPPLRKTPLDAPQSLPRNPLPEPDLPAAERRELTLEGGMMSGMMGGGGGMGGGMGGMMGGGMMHGMRGMMGMGQSVWSINGTSMTGDGHAGMAPLFTLGREKSHLVTIRNRTAWWHPMHLHGFTFKVLTRNGAPVPHNQWADTVLLAPDDAVDIAFVADNPGDWMLHCHVTDHQTAGLMTVLRVGDGRK